MNLNKIARKLRREAAASPQKAAVLGILAVVALYFWAPLVWGWFQGDPNQVAAVPASQSAAIDAGLLGAITAANSPAPTAAAGTKQTPENVTWKQIVEWIARDPRTAAAPLPAEERDPFVTPASEQAQAEEANQEPIETTPPPPVVYTPEGLGLKLTSTLVDGNRSLARINGRNYRQGETFEVSHEGTSVALTVARIELRRVLLTCGEEEMELNLPAPGESDRIVLSEATH